MSSSSGQFPRHQAATEEARPERGTQWWRIVPPCAAGKRPRGDARSAWTSIRAARAGSRRRGSRRRRLPAPRTRNWRARSGRVRPRRATRRRARSPGLIRRATAYTASRARMTTLYSPSAPAGSFTRPVHASGARGSRWHPRSSRRVGVPVAERGREPTTSASPSPVQSGIENASRTTRSVAGASPRESDARAPPHAQGGARHRDAARRASGAGASRPRRPVLPGRRPQRIRRAGGALARTPEAEAEARPAAAAAGAGAGATASP